MNPIIKYIILTGVRDRIYVSLFLTLIISFSVSIFLGSTALIEQRHMTSAYIAGSSRIIMVFGMILFVCLNLSRAFENKEVEFVISKSISRQKYILGYLISYLVTAALIFVPLIIAMMIVIKPAGLGMAIWSLSLMFELAIMICFAILASLILQNAFISIFASFGFYILSRMIAIFVMAIEMPTSLLDFKIKTFGSILKLMSVFFPRLDLYAQSSWLTYNIEDLSQIKIIALQSAIFIPLMIFMAFHDFKKKQF